jgi:hypothetical protein
MKDKSGGRSDLGRGAAGQPYRLGTPRDAAGTACGGTPQLHDHTGGDGFVGAGVDEDEGAGGAVAAVGIVDEGDGVN